MSQTHTIQLQTHRFLFSEDVVGCLSNFAQIHQFDERKTFKAEWQKYIENQENKTLLANEVNRLLGEGFEGDPYDKFFKSVRYYYRKKLGKDKIDNEKSPRKGYETLDRDILREMDEHIKSQIASNINNHASSVLVSMVSPASSFDDYCSNNKRIILEESFRCKRDDDDDADSSIQKVDIENTISRLKKTYKNRFYKIRTTLME
jgi:hypothetical protein